MAFLGQIASTGASNLRPAGKTSDRSAPLIDIVSPDALSDEQERREYFFNTGCKQWFHHLEPHTFSSTFCPLRVSEAKLIVQFRESTTKTAQDAALGQEEAAERDSASFHALVNGELRDLCQRLDLVVKSECEKSAVGKAFVKLTTRSPKDSTKAFDRAAQAYWERVDSAPEVLTEDEKWNILSEEVTNAGAVTCGREALELLLDSDRVLEDLSYALEPGPGGQQDSVVWEHVCLVARSWDPRLTPVSEFRGIVWGGKLTCLGQYYHSIHFPALKDQAQAVEGDIRATFHLPGVQAAVQSTGGNCIIDFAWLGSGEVVVIELNPFDGVCLGTFPASTGLFKWEDPVDQRVMRGQDPFEFRIRTEPVPKGELLANCNMRWRRVILGQTQEK